MKKYRVRQWCVGTHNGRSFLFDTNEILTFFLESEKPGYVWVKREREREVLVPTHFLEELPEVEEKSEPEQKFKDGDKVRTVRDCESFAGISVSAGSCGIVMNNNIPVEGRVPVRFDGIDRGLYLLTSDLELLPSESASDEEKEAPAQEEPVDWKFRAQLAATLYPSAHPSIGDVTGWALKTADALIAEAKKPLEQSTKEVAA